MTTNELFEKGLSLLKSNNHLSALACFEKIISIRKDPLVQSYFALCIAIERGKVTEAISLCEDAIKLDTANPVHYLNLGKIYLKAKRRIEAIDTLRTGLSFGDNEEIKAILEKLGTRKKPTFSFLPRGHFLNRYTGLLLKKMRLI